MASPASLPSSSSSPARLRAVSRRGAPRTYVPERIGGDIAWALGVSPSTASRWLDRAEREGLVDKVYGPVDRRGTSGRLTEKGVELRVRVERILATMPSNERPRGVAWGIRASPRWER